MGARSNIVIQDGKERVWLYGHWMACGAVAHAAAGLASDRFDSPGQLADVVYRDMIERPTGEGRGWAISTRMQDNQYPILVIDSRHGNGMERGSADVWFEDEDGLRTSPVYSREEFLAVADTIAPFRPSWDDPSGHDCAYRYFRDRVDDADPRLSLPGPRDQIRDV